MKDDSASSHSIRRSRSLAVVGGVALNVGLVHILEEEIGFKVLVPQDPQMVAALGAAVVARENIDKGLK